MRYHTVQADKNSVNKQQAHRAHDITGVQGLCGEHPSVRQRILDPALPAREEGTQQLPYALLETHPWIISWRDKLTSNALLERASIPTMFTLLKQRRIRWLGHVYRMEDGHTPKDLLYVELVT